MKQPLVSLLVLPPALLALLCQATANPNPTALRKLPPDSNEKLFPEHLAFAPAADLLHDDTLSLDNTYALDDRGIDGSAGYYRRAFGANYDESEDGGILRRAAEALAILERRTSCPSGMNSCEDEEAPNKCCQDGTYCTRISNTGVGNIACCPDGSTCGGGVGECPSDATECPASLGGGCCIPGYICQGIGCVTSTSLTVTETAIVTTTEEEEETTTTTTTTTTTEAEPTTESTTEAATTTEPDDETETETEPQTTSETAEGEAPWRPTVTSGMTTDAGDTQTGCPTGFYGCLATHGGGCCRTDRDCETHSCPAPSKTTIVSDGVTVIVAVDDLPEATATSTCADGWFMCGEGGGPVAGCCPSGYDCGTASCFTVRASETQEVQKELPDADSGASSRLFVAGMLTRLSVAVMGASLVVRISY